MLVLRLVKTIFVTLNCAYVLHPLIICARYSIISSMSFRLSCYFFICLSLSLKLSFSVTFLSCLLFLNFLNYLGESSIFVERCYSLIEPHLSTFSGSVFIVGGSGNMFYTDIPELICVLFSDLNPWSAWCFCFLLAVILSASFVQGKALHCYLTLRWLFWGGISDDLCGFFC